MSNFVLPELLGLDVKVDRSPAYKSQVFENPGGTEQRVSLMSAARHRWRLSYTVRDDFYCDSPYQDLTELGLLQWFFDVHYGAYDSFLFYDPIARRNLLLRSAEFNNASWSKGTGVTTAADATTDPIYGATTADRIDYDGLGSSGGDRIWQSAATAQIGKWYTTSMWLKAASGTPTVVLTDGLGGTLSCPLTATWQRFQLTTFAASAATLQATIASPAGVNSTFSIYAWGAQLEPYPNAGPYQATTTAAYSGQVRVRFSDDQMRVTRIAHRFWDVSFELIQVSA